VWIIHKISVLAVFIALVLGNVISPAHAVLSTAAIPAVFNKLLNSPALANPSMILIDGRTGEVVFKRNSFSQRKPASLMKIFAAAATLEYFDPNYSFRTSISFGQDSKTLIINGSYDPWISVNDVVAKKMKRVSLPHLGFSALNAVKKANNESLEGYKVEYFGLNSQDYKNLKAFWGKRGFNPIYKKVTLEKAIADSSEEIVTEFSPTVKEILDFTMLWSDNVLAERLARLSARAAGYPFNNEGVYQTFTDLLTRFEIDSSPLVIIDASGLSKQNRITANLLGKLLYKLRKEEKFATLYESLPIGGVSGTLKDRFLTTAPSAIGLVRAKTGTLNGTVSLAGYVETNDREYIFVTIADKIPKGSKANSKARAAIDRILGRIAAPNIPAVISEATSAP